jgi:hypothetical protein
LKEAQLLLHNGLAQSSRASYSTGAKKYLAFCASHEILVPFPASESDLCLFATFESRTVLYRTVRSYLYGVRSAHIDLGLEDPIRGKHQLHRLLRGIKRMQGVKPPMERFPVTLQVLETLYTQVDWERHDDAMLFCAWSAAVFGLLRSGEFCVDSPTSTDRLLRNSQLSNVLESQGVRYRRLLLEGSKTDPFREGIYIILGESPSAACFLKAFDRYQALRSNRAKGPQEALFAFEDGS